MNKRHLLKLGLASLPALALFLHPVFLIPQKLQPEEPYLPPASHISS